MDPFIVLFILIVFIGISAWIFETKIVGSMPFGEPWNWFARVIFWCAILYVVWHYVWPMVRTLHI